LQYNYDFARRREICDIILSSSLCGTRPITIQFMKHTKKSRKKYSCISCAIKGTTIIEEIIRVQDVQ